jgi:hypothetical protein
LLFFHAQPCPQLTKTPVKFAQAGNKEKREMVNLFQALVVPDTRLGVLGTIGAKKNLKTLFFI